MKAVALALAGLWLAAPALAQGLFEDPATGFAVKAPAGFVAEASSGRRQFDVGVGINPTGPAPRKAGKGTYLCEAGFKANASNAGMSRQEINAFVDKPEWVNLARAAFEMGFRVTGQQRFTLQGYRGVEFQAVPKAGPGAEEARVLVSLVETPKGRVTMICSVQKADFAGALPKLRAIRAGITLPQ